MIKEKVKFQWTQLINMLRSACHAKDCKTIIVCPNYCQCRSRRPFKLNIETAVCWEMANILSRELLYNNITPSRRELLSCKFSTLSIITIYHSSRGWSNFFKETTNVVKILTDPNSFYLDILPSQYIDKLKNRVNRLKREVK